MKLFPPIDPYNKGFLKVSEIHSIYYEQCGNPKGKPVLYLHGGPGAGCSEKSRRYFDPKKFRIILFDQRGAGRSRPQGSVVENTTQLLVEDIRKLLIHLDLKRVFLFGGSWGSTLALCYAVKFPKTVVGMLLRGIFLGTREEISYLYCGQARTHNPDEWERFINQLPANEQKDPLKAYMKRLLSKDPRTRSHFGFEWCFFESSLCTVYPRSVKIAQDLKKRPFVAFARIECHYMVNDCFLPKEYILKNVKKIRHIPLSIVHGRQDMVCPSLYGYRLHKQLLKARFKLIPCAGHTINDGGIGRALLQEMKWMGSMVKW